MLDSSAESTYTFDGRFRERWTPIHFVSVQLLFCEIGHQYLQCISEFNSSLRCFAVFRFLLIGETLLYYYMNIDELIYCVNYSNYLFFILFFIKWFTLWDN